MSAKPELTKCSREIYEKGTTVAVMVNSTPEIIESIVKEASKESGVEMDWFYMGGRAVVKTLGDVPKAQWALKCATPTIRFWVNETLCESVPYA